MNQLFGKYVNIVLSIECGRGMEFIKNNVNITGNFNGRILESDKIPAEASPAFNTELIWEVEKKELRKIRSANQPLRVECITTDVHNRRERVGFALLSLRSAHIIPQKEANREVKFTWQKLIGCQADKKKSHPELFMSLVLRDHLLNDYDVSNNSFSAMTYISEEYINTADIQESPFPVQYLDNGHVQIGREEDAKETFQLNLLIENVMNLDTLLPEELVFQHGVGPYFLSFNILGIAVKTKPFQKDFHNSIVLKEKIVVTLVSNRETLASVFASQTISISFHHGSDRLGVVELILGEIFMKKYMKGYFKLPSQNSFVPHGCSEKSPYIEIQASIDQYIQNYIYSEVSEKPKPKSIFSNMSKRLGNNELITSIDSENIDENQVGMEGDHTNISSVQESIEGIVMEEDPLTSRSICYPNSYKKYVVQLKLKNLIWGSIPEDTKIIFKFLHPRSPTNISILTDMKGTSENIVLNNLEIKLGFISSPGMIEQLLRTWCPKLVLTDDKECPICLEHPLNVNCVYGAIEYEIVLHSINKSNVLAKVAIKAWLKSFDFEDVEDYEHLYLLPVMVDEIITIKEVKELEKWRKQARVHFEKEHENIINKEIERLGDEWKAKKVHLEKQLTNAVDKCKALQKDLEKKVNILKIEKSLHRNRDSNKIYQEIFENNWNKYNKYNTRELIEVLSKSQRDNQFLILMVQDQKEKLSVFEKSTLTKYQTNVLLQELKVLEERFEEVQNAKRYFKEQWIKECQEVHEFRTDEVNNPQIQIKSSKEQLGVNKIM